MPQISSRNGVLKPNLSSAQIRRALQQSKLAHAGKITTMSTKKLVLACLKKDARNGS
jgi:hypothetical protein